MTAAQRAFEAAIWQRGDLHRRLWTQMWEPTWCGIRGPVREQMRYSDVQAIALNTLQSIDMRVGEKAVTRAALRQHINTTRRQS